MSEAGIWRAILFMFLSCEHVIAGWKFFVSSTEGDEDKKSGWNFSFTLCLLRVTTPQPPGQMLVR